MTNAIDTVKVGRVFFTPDSGADVEAVTVLTLESHVGNVVDLVKKFQGDFYPTFKQGGVTNRDLLIRAAQKQDDAKPETFRVTYRGWKDNDYKSLGHSFAGHRFRVSDDNRSVELLIRLHHEFSVEEVVKAQAELGAHKEFSKAEVKNFPIDLYILEMCDQVEAELETYAFTCDAQPRVFMDFHSRIRGDGKIEISPYPFGCEEMPLSLSYYEFDVPEESRCQIAKALAGHKPEEGQRLLREIIVKAHTYTDCQQKEMILCQAH